MVTENDSPPKEEPPPIFKHWKIHYAVVLVFHTLMLLLFSWLTITFQ